MDASITGMEHAGTALKALFWIKLSKNVWRWIPNLFLNRNQLKKNFHHSKKWAREKLMKIAYKLLNKTINVLNVLLDTIILINCKSAKKSILSVEHGTKMASAQAALVIMSYQMENARNDLNLLFDDIIIN